MSLNALKKYALSDRFGAHALRGAVTSFRRTSLYNNYKWVGEQMRPITLPDMPHMDADETAALRRLLENAGTYLEYGSGGSTIFAAGLGVPKIISVESDPRFVAALRDKFRGAVSDIDIMHCDIGRVRSWGRPLNMTPTEENIRRWNNYALAPWRKIHEAGTYPDVVLIDGRFRVNCALTSLLEQPADRKITYLFEDYADRHDQYQIIEKFIQNARPVGRGLIYERAAGLDTGMCRKVQRDYACDIQ